MTLNITKIKKIVELHNLGFSQRAIADNVKTSKTTVNKYIKSNYGNQLINPVPVANKTNFNKWQVVDIPYTPPIQPLPYNSMDPQIPYQQNYVGYGNNSFRDQMMSEEQIQQQQFEDQRLERERNWKHAQQIGAEIKSLEEKEARERKQSQLNQLQFGIDMLKIEQKHTRWLFEFSKKTNQVLINKSVLAKEEKTPITLKPVSIYEDKREKEDVSEIEEKPKLEQKPKVYTVPQPAVQISQEEPKEEDEDEIEVPEWLISGAIQAGSKIIKLLSDYKIKSRF